MFSHLNCPLWEQHPLEAVGKGLCHGTGYSGEWGGGGGLEQQVFALATQPVSSAYLDVYTQHISYQNPRDLYTTICPSTSLMCKCLENGFLSTVVFPEVFF